MSKKITRGIGNKDFIDNLKTSQILEKAKTDPDLFVGIRNDYINIYYMGASLAKMKFVKGGFRFSVANKYIDPKLTSGYDENYTEDGLINDLDNIKTNICNYQIVHKKYEKISQQLLIMNNNKNTKSNWFCIDMEYILQRYNKSQPAFGRFDIIAILKEEKPYKIALIELKYGVGAYSGNYGNIKNWNPQNGSILSSNINAGSGILGHICDYIRYINPATCNTIKLKDELVSIINNYNQLGLLCPIKNIQAADIDENPLVYFITIGVGIKKAREQMKKYLLDIKGASKYNAQKVLGKDFSKPNKVFNPIFLFSDDDGKKITDIIDDEKYMCGFM